MGMVEDTQLLHGLLHGTLRLIHGPINNLMRVMDLLIKQTHQQILLLSLTLTLSLVILQVALLIKQQLLHLFRQCQ